MQYAGGYHPSQPIMIWFWEVIEQLTPDQQRQFLRFMTSCSRQPLLGFRALEPLPCIQQVRVFGGYIAQRRTSPIQFNMYEFIETPQLWNQSAAAQEIDCCH
jgi:hypothetical protein